MFHFHCKRIVSYSVLYLSTDEEIGVPDQIHPGLDHSLDNQINIAHSLFNIILATIRNREELEQSLLAISQDLDLVDAQDRNRQHRNYRNQ